MDEGLQEGILNCLINLRGVTKLVVSDSCDSRLMGIYDFFKPVPCFFMVS